MTAQVSAAIKKEDVAVDAATLQVSHLLRLPYKERTSAIIQKARGENARSLFQSLSRSSNFDARWAAVQSACITRDADIVVRATSDTSALIRAHAVSVLAQVGSNEQVLIGFESVSYPLRRRLMSGLRRQRRWAVMRTIVQQLREQKEMSEVRRLFGLCDAEVISQLLPAHGQYMSLWQWNKVAKANARMAASVMLEIVKSMTAPDPGVLEQASTIVPLIARECKSELWELFVLLRRWFPTSSLPLAKAANKRPNLIADLVIHWAEFVPNAVQINRITKERLCAIIRLKPSAIKAVNWRRRGIRRHVVEVFEKLRSDGVFGKESIPTSLLEVLPASQRYYLTQELFETQIESPKDALSREGRFFHQLTEQEVQEYQYLRPYEVAYPLLTGALNSEQLGIRSQAFESLCRLICFHPDKFDTIIDPLINYSQSMDATDSLFASLRRLPPKWWRKTHLEHLDHVIASVTLKRPNQDVLQAILNLLMSLFCYNPELIARMMKRVEHDDHNLDWTVFERTDLSSDCCRLLSEVFVSALKAKGNIWSRIDAAGRMLKGLGRNICHFHHFIDQHFSQISEGANMISWYINSTFGTIKRHDHRFFESMAAELLEKDCTLLQSSVIFTHFEKTDLKPIDRWLDSDCCGRGMLNEEGKPYFPFMFRKTRIFLDVSRQLRLQEIVRQHLLEKDADGVHHAISLLGLCHGVPPESSLLSHIASQPIDEARLARAATDALCQHDDIRCIHHVLSNLLTKEDARDTIYQCRRRLLSLTPKEALEMIEKFDTSMVSTHKEVCRLLGDLRIKEPLLAFFDSEKTHRDVKVAIIRALWNWRDDETIWHFFRKCAGHPEWKIARKLTFISLNGVSAFGRRQLIIILLKCLQRPEVGLRKAALERIALKPIGDPEGLLTNAMLTTVETGTVDEQTLATTALFTYCAGPAITQEHAEKTLVKLSTNIRAFEAGLDNTCSGCVHEGCDATDKVLLACLSILDRRNDAHLKLQLKAILHIRSVVTLAQKLEEYIHKSDAHLYLFLIHASEYAAARLAGMENAEAVLNELLNHKEPTCHVFAGHIINEKMEAYYFVRDTLKLTAPIDRLRNSDNLLVKSMGMNILGPKEPNFGKELRRAGHWRERPPRGDISDLPGVELPYGIRTRACRRLLR